jgi:hypothetical protein
MSEKGCNYNMRVSNLKPNSEWNNKSDFCENAVDREIETSIYMVGLVNINLGVTHCATN